MKLYLGLENNPGDSADEVLCLGAIKILQSLYYSDNSKIHKRDELKKCFESSVITQSFSYNYKWNLNNSITKYICRTKLNLINSLFFGIKKIISSK